MALKQLLCFGVLILDFEQAFFTKQIVDLKFFIDYYSLEQLKLRKQSFPSLQ